MSAFRTWKHLGSVVAGLLAAATVAAQNVNVGGQDVSVVFAVASARKGVTLVPASPSGPSGQVVIPPGVASGLKKHDQVRIYYRRNQCTHKKEVLIAPPDMTAEQIADAEKKKGQDCGGLIFLQDAPWRSDTNVTIDYSGDVPTVTTSSVTPAGAGAVAPSKALFSLEAGGWAGFANVGGGQQGAFQQTFGAPLNNSPNNFAGGVGALFNFGPVVFGTSLWRVNASDSDGSFSLRGGGTDTAKISQQFQGVDVTGGVRIPVGPKVSFIVDGGLGLWQANNDTEDIVANGTTTTIAMNSRTVNGTGWKAGSIVQVDVSHGWSLMFRYDYNPLNNAGVNVHLHRGSVGLTKRLWRSKRVRGR